MKTVASMLAQFHNAFSQWDDQERVSDKDARCGLHEEENEELVRALASGDRVAIARELADVVYVAYGTALVFDIPLDEVLAEVHRANMSKANHSGVLELDDCGKVIKSDRFKAPDIASVLGST